MKINELILFTNNLDKQIDFYSIILGFQILNSTPESCSFKVGDSILIFKYRKDVVPYHFAINIPSNKEIEALNWLKERVAVLSFDGNEIIDFSNWNAKAIYFYDIDKNIVEFISRKNLNLNSSLKFPTKLSINISEIGIVTDNIEETYDSLIKINKISVFSGDFDRFCAVGDDQGLFIIVNNKFKKWFPTGDLIEQSDFSIKGDFNFKYTNGKIIEVS